MNRFLRALLPPERETTVAACAAIERRVGEHFDAIEAVMQRIHDRMVADGLIRDTNARERLGESES